MTRDETRQIREAALEDTDLTQSARLLLSFIIDWHHKEKGCVMHDSTLGERMGMSERTIRRRRQELVEAGYLDVKHGAHRRELAPKDPDNAVQPPDTDVQEADTRDETPDTDGRPPPDTDVQDREINNPEGTREGAAAPAREAISLGGDGAPSSAEESPLEAADDSVDAITRAAFGEPVRGLTVKDEIRTYCERAGPEGWDCLRSACALISRKSWNPTAQLVKKKLADQLEMLDESDEQQQNNDFASKAKNIHRAARQGAGLDGH